MIPLITEALCLLAQDPNITETTRLEVLTLIEQMSQHNQSFGYRPLGCYFPPS